MIYPWLQDQWQRIAHMRRQQRLAHALLLTGPDQAGIEAFATALAQAVLCETEDDEACGRCSSCRLFLAGNHPDYFHVAAESGSETIKIDVLRTVCASLVQKSSHGGYQVVFIERADYMQAAGANALLKTLEEPEGDVLFILWAKRYEALPATIHSRTQRINLADGEPQLMQAWLEKNLSLDGKPWLKAAGNRPLAVRSLQEGDYFAARDALIAMLQSVRDKVKSALDAVEWMEDWDRAVYFQAVLSIVGDGLRHALGIGNQYWVNEDKVAEIQRLFQNLSAVQLKNLYDFVQHLWRLQQLPQVLNQGLLDCQLWLEWDKQTRAAYVN